MHRNVRLLGLGVAVVLLASAASASSAVAGRSVQLPRNADVVVAPAISDPVFVGLEASSFGVAWEVMQAGDTQDAGRLYYSAFGGAHGVDAGLTGPADESYHVEHPFSLVDKQLYIPQRGGQPGIDITTGAALPTLHDCIRTGTGCLVIDQVGVNSDYQYSYIDDATGTTKSVSPVLIEGTTTPMDRVWVRAIDADGAVLYADGPRDPQSHGLAATLVYLDFASGQYTELDDTVYAQSASVAMDPAHVVWTHDEHALYLNRSDLSAAPLPATSDGAVVGVAVNGDTFAYNTVSPDDNLDTPSHVITIHTGALGGTSFTAITSQIPAVGVVGSIDDGDFLAQGGTTAANYGLYRVIPGQSIAGPPIVLFGFALHRNYPPDNWDGSDHSAPAVIDTSQRWSISGVAGPPVQYGTTGDIPTVRSDGSGAAHIGVFRPSTGRWYLRGSTPIQHGTKGDIPVQAHYHGRDKGTVIGVFRPSTGRWYIYGAPSFTYGRTADIPVPAHYYGTPANDYADQPAVFRPSTGWWYIRGHTSVHYGARGDVPVPGDYDGDGRTDIAVYRPSTHTWYIRGHAPVRYGTRGDIPVTGDYNGDGRTDIAVYRPSTHTWYTRGQHPIVFGHSGDQPIGQAPLHG